MEDSAEIAAELNSREKISITVSVGVNMLRNGVSVEASISKADSALYQAKIQGRNQIVLAGENQTTIND